jgi:hypothetical protein
MSSIRAGSFCKSNDDRWHPRRDNPIGLAQWMQAPRKRAIAHHARSGDLKAPDERATRRNVRALAAICAALRVFVPADIEANRTRRSPLHLGGSTTGLSGIGACEAIADDDATMRPIRRFSQPFVPRPPNRLGRARVLINCEARRLETNTTMPHMTEATLRGPGEPRVRIPVKRFLACPLPFQ